MAISGKSGAALTLGRVRIELTTLALGALLLCTTILDFTIYAGQPLGVDEVWTGMIAGQSSLAGLIRQCEIEVNGPLSYVIAWLWAPLGGLSNAGLRLPSTLFVCATPFMALAPSRLMPSAARITWAVLLACWLPEFAFAQLARCYALTILLATANTVAYARLLSRPRFGAAAIWSVLSALLILDHYFAVILIGCQGFTYLAVRRRDAMRTWPAALIFIPVMADVAFKAQTLFHFAKPGVAWIDRLSVEDLPGLVAFLAGSPVLAGFIACALAVGGFLYIRRNQPSEARGQSAAGDAMVVPALVATLAAAVSIGLGFLFPILTARYLAPEVPGLMLGVALLAARFSKAWPVLPGLVMAGAVGVVVGLISHARLAPQPAVAAFSFERAAKALIRDNPRRLVFFWDNPVSQGGDPGQLSGVGGFFFKRTGHSIPVDAVTSAKGADPNAVLLARAAAPGTDILWMFDRDVEGTAAAAYPPDIPRLDPRWTCRDFGGGGEIGILACHRREPVASVGVPTPRMAAVRA